MADVSKLKRGKGLGTPPAPEEVATSLSAPEVAPAATVNSSHVVADQPSDMSGHRRPDGRSARKSNRTLAFGTRVTPEFDREVREIADREGILLVEVLERAIKAYKEKRGF